MPVAETMLAILLSAGASPTDDGPRGAIERYFQARALGSGECIRRAFTPDAKIVLVEEGRSTQSTTEQAAGRLQGPASDEHRRVRRVERLDVSDFVASAVLTLDYPRVLFTDHVSLLKVGSQWKIASMLSSARKREAGHEVIQSALRDWSLPFQPRRIAGNVYYVGTNLISSFLIATPAGDILLDAGHAQMLPQVAANIAKLGFDLKNVKILLNSHAHFDHCGAFAEVKRRTGATVIASRLDGELMMRGGKGDFFWGDDLAYEPVKPDRIVLDGERVELGGTSLTAHLTPGHTKGCTTWSMRVREDGKDHDVVFVCGLVASLYKLANNAEYRDIVEQVRNTLRRLRDMHADIMLASHGFYFDLENKVARQRPGDPNPFVDPGELQRHVAEIEKDFDEALRMQERQR